VSSYSLAAYQTFYPLMLLFPLCIQLAQHEGTVILVAASVSDPDPNSIGFLDPDPHSECGSGSRSVKLSKTEVKNEAERQKIHHKKLNLVDESMVF
jgi:hypothetical protein